MTVGLLSHWMAFRPRLTYPTIPACFPLVFICGATLLAGVTGTAHAGWSDTGIARNRGQIDEVVRYYGSTNGLGVFFTDRAIVADLGHASAIYIYFAGADSAPKLEAHGKKRHRLNYFRGSDSTSWHRSIPTYQELTYRGLWPGVDLTFRLEETGLSYGVSSADGGDPSRVAFRYEGAHRVARVSDKVTVIETVTGSITHERSPGDGTPQAGGAGILARGFFSPEPRPLPRDVPAAGGIDGEEELIFSTYIGGDDHERCYDVGSDRMGNLVVTGSAPSLYFPTTPGAYDRSHNGVSDVFVTKLASSGSQLVWSTFIGGCATDEGAALEIDSNGFVVITGSTYSVDFPTTPTAFDQSHNGGADVFVTKLNGAGDSLIWSTLVGGNDGDQGWDVVLDPTLDIILTGFTFSPDFPTTAGAFDSSPNGSYDAFLCQLSSTGSSLCWSTCLGGTGSDYGRDLAVNEGGDLIVTGYTASADFPVTSDVYDESHNGGYDVFLSCLGNQGDTLLASTFLGGSNSEYGYALALSPAGNPVLAGYSDSPDFPATPGVWDESYNGGYDIVAAEMAPDLTSLNWSTFLGGEKNDHGFAVAHDIAGNPVVAGGSYSCDFPTTPGAYDEFCNGGSDVVIARLSVNGNALLWSSFLGGFRGDQAWGLYVYANGSMVVVGDAKSPNFPTTAGAFDVSFNGVDDVFVSKFDRWGASGITPDPFDSPSAQERILPGSRCFPQPSTTHTSIRFMMPYPGAISVRIIDSGGRLIRAWSESRPWAGEQTVSWNGRDDRGSPVSAGVYFYEIRAKATGGDGALSPGMRPSRDGAGTEALRAQGKLVILR